MNQLFITQLIISFIVGGSLIALLSFIAEHVSSQKAGIILALPSTTALGFFFLGWTVSAEAAAAVVPATLIPLGILTLFPVVYIHVAQVATKFFKNKGGQIVVSFLSASIFWLILINFLLQNIRWGKK